MTEAQFAECQTALAIAHLVELQLQHARNECDAWVNSDYGIKQAGKVEALTRVLADIRAGAWRTP